MIDLRPRHLEMVNDIVSRFVPDCAVWVFGSRVLGTAQKFSDLDLVIECKNGPLGFSRIGELREAFSESDLPIKVDVIDYTQIDDEFRNRIDQHKVLLVEAQQ